MKKISTATIIDFVKDINIKNFLKDAFENLEDSGISINFYNNRTIKMEDGRAASGWFSDEEKDISCIFLKRKKHQAYWLGIFIHEYSHFLQWKSNDPTFLRTINGTDPNTIMSSFLLEKEYQTESYTHEEIKEACEAVLELEYDAEYTVVELIKMYNLEKNIDSIEYVKSAVAYFIFIYNSYKRNHWHNVSINANCESYKNFLSLLPNELSKEVLTIDFLNKWEAILEEIYTDFKNINK